MNIHSFSVQIGTDASANRTLFRSPDQSKIEKPLKLEVCMDVWQTLAGFGCWPENFTVAFEKVFLIIVHKLVALEFSAACTVYFGRTHRDNFIEMYS